jgi:LAGLIDADG DNA endonuclease family protein
LLNIFKEGKISEHYIGNNIQQYRINGLANVTVIFPYFDQHNLRSKKLKSYIIWRDLHTRLINKEHLDKSLRPSLKLLASKVNNT